MSWLARSFANSLRLDDGDHHDITTAADNYTTKPDTPSSSRSQHDKTHPKNAHLSEEDQSRGVKEDLSELKLTLSRQFLGVASFLAPPPTTPSSAVGSGDSDWNRCEPSDRPEGEDQLDWNRCEPLDLEEEVGRFEGIDSIGVKGVSNIYLIGSDVDVEDFDEDEFGDAVGVTEEVLTFATNIAMHPETWLDFPIDEEDDIEDFDMSDTQLEHVMAVEHLTPTLAALRFELCPCHMSEGYFWRVYFVLLHSRLNKHDADLLLTPQVKAARALWMDELQKKTKQEQEWSRRDAMHEELVNSPYYSSHYYEDRQYRTFFSEAPTSSGTSDYEIDKHPMAVTETEIVDKSVIVEKSVVKVHDKDIRSSNYMVQNYDDEDEDDWLKDENMEEISGYASTFLISNEEDVSFSDLEDDDDIVVPIKSKS